LKSAGSERRGRARLPVSASIYHVVLAVQTLRA
jgi:hypothetical protein